ncbi:MAG TPA: anaerobic ribonucleoside-triphosphate reductase activating protein [Bacillota bacterium]
MKSEKENFLIDQASQTTVRIAGVATESVVDGPGIRSTVFFQGCRHACPGCHNPETWDTAGGRQVTLAELIDLLKLNPLISGVTFSGGEPFLQAGPAAVLGNHLRKLGLNLWVYTGFTWEDLMNTPDHPENQALLEIATVVVDGPFRQQLKDLSLPFRGSANQRLIDAQASLAAGRVVIWSPDPGGW